MDVDVSPLSDSGCRELYPEGDRNRITGESGQAGNGAALLRAMGASGMRGGGSARVRLWEASVHRGHSHSFYCDIQISKTTSPIQPGPIMSGTSG